MSRAFNGGIAADSITFSAGNAPTKQGPITVAVLAKAASTAGWTGNLIKGKAGGSNSWALLTTNNGGAKLFVENDFGNGVAGLSTSWTWYVFTKASGSNLPRISTLTIGGSWAHTNNTANVGDNFSPVDTIYVGADGSGSAGQTWRGSIAVCAAWSSVLTDLQIESTMTLNAADVFAASPNWMIRLNQASTATPVSDDTGGGGNQTALSGTSIDSDDPPGFNYSLSGTPTLSPTGIHIPAAVGTPTVSQSFALTPTGISIPVALGTPNVTGPTYTPPTPANSGTGSWWNLKGIIDGTRTILGADMQRGWYACPNDGEPLRRSKHGVLYCPFDNWQPPGQ